jgi:hypothetical protein
MNLAMEFETTLRKRNLLFFATPSLWPLWPFLPLVRRRPGCTDELGLMYDVFHVTGTTGASATVFFGNMFQMPSTEREFLALPNEVYDSAEEVFESGWRVD